MYGNNVRNTFFCFFIPLCLTFFAVFFFFLQLKFAVFCSAFIFLHFWTTWTSVAWSDRVASPLAVKTEPMSSSEIVSSVAADTSLDGFSASGEVTSPFACCLVYPWVCVCVYQLVCVRVVPCTNMHAAVQLVSERWVLRQAAPTCNKCSFESISLAEWHDVPAARLQKSLKVKTD